MRRLRFSVTTKVMLVSATMLLCECPALAAPAKADDAAIEEAAKARYKEGLKLYNKKKYEEARAAFLQASALKRRPAATLMLAQSSLRAGRWLEALRELDAYVAEQGEVPQKLQDVVDLSRHEARQHLGRIHFDLPEGAEVTIDGERATAAIDKPVDVMPGPHTIVIKHHDEKKTVQIEASPNATTEVKPLFVPKALVPTTDARTRPVPASSGASSSSSSASNATRSGEPGTDQESSPSILSPPSTTWPIYVSGAIGLGGLAAAAIFGGLAANAQHAVDVSRETIRRAGKDENVVCKEGTNPAEFTETCITLRKNEPLAASHRSTFGASLIVGLSGTAIALGWFFLAPKERAPSSSSPPTDASRESKAVQIVPWVGLTSGGATFEGRF